MPSKFQFIPNDWILSADLRKWIKAQGLSDQTIATVSPNQYRHPQELSPAQTEQERIKGDVNLRRLKEMSLRVVK